MACKIRLEVVPAKKESFTKKGPSEIQNSLQRRKVNKIFPLVIPGVLQFIVFNHSRAKKGK